METVTSAVRILSKVESGAFVGRSDDLQRIVTHGRGESPSRGLSVLSRPGAGSSELLSQAYNQIFTADGPVIPFYFKVKSADKTANAAAIRYLHDFLAQIVAFQRRELSIKDAAFEFPELLDLAAPEDRPWMDRLFAGGRDKPDLDDGRLHIRHCLSAPFRKFKNDHRVFVIIDDLDEAAFLEGGTEFIDDILGISASGSARVAVCGHRRFLYDRTTFPALRLDRPSFVDAGRMIESIASRRSVTISDQTRDLVAVQLDRNPKLIDALLLAALESKTELKSFAAVQQIYTDAIFGGRISRHFDRIIKQLSVGNSLETKVIHLLQETGSSENSRLPLADWKDRLDVSDKYFDSITQRLFEDEMINLDGDHVILDRSDVTLSDYIDARVSLLDGVRKRALIVGEATARNVKRAPQLMARYYKKGSSLGLLELIRGFDGRSVSHALLDYSRYRDELKGAPKARVVRVLQEDNTRTPLPEVIFAAHSSAFYPQLNEICQPERSVTAIATMPAAEAGEIVWIAAEIESKLEATRELAEFWCDRLEMVAVNCGFDNYRIWLISPEGFTHDAMDLLAERDAIGSSRAQAELLASMLLEGPANIDKAPATLYEFIVPMGDDTEMIAANTIEEIARHHHVPAKSINQLKTALIEACINASEHSHSPDRKIYQTIAIDEEKIAVTVANRGLRIVDRVEKPDDTDAGRRGWGLRLIKGLMDEVQIEETDDGTRITMVKYLQTQAASDVTRPVAVGSR